MNDVSIPVHAVAPRLKAAPTAVVPSDHVTASISIPAYAKVNLTLAVGPPEPPSSPRPGWHKIASWMSCIDLADDLTLARLLNGSPSTYSITWAPDAPRPTPIDWLIDKDLAVRAHRLLEQHAARPLPIDLRLAKRIPVGGGLGGGSSDAAAVLTGLNQLFNLNLSVDELQRLGAELGSDVIFFIDEQNPPRSAIVGGFGDQIERQLPWDADLLLIIPPFGCPTREVYLAYDRALDHPSDVMTPPRTFFFNDLLAPACSVRPQLADLLQRLKNISAQPIAMTGSGSCLFLEVQSREIPDITARIRARAPECVCVPTRLI